MRYLVTTFLLLATTCSTNMIGGYAKSSCERQDTGIRVPGHAVNHAVRFAQSLTRQKELKLIYFSIQSGGGSNYRVVFTTPNDDLPKIQYVAIQISTSLPHYKQAPKVSKMLITYDVKEIHNFFKIPEGELTVEERCTENLLDDINTFDLAYEMQVVADRFADYNNRKKEKATFKDLYDLPAYTVSHGYSNFAQPLEKTQSVVEKLSIMLNKATEKFNTAPPVPIEIEENEKPVTKPLTETPPGIKQSVEVSENVPTHIVGVQPPQVVITNEVPLSNQVLIDEVEPVEILEEVSKKIETSPTIEVAESVTLKPTVTEDVVISPEIVEKTSSVPLKQPPIIEVNEISPLEVHKPHHTTRRLKNLK